MESQHMTQQTFSQLLGISSASLSSIFNDRTKPTLNHVDAIKKRFPSINLDWLLYGTGTMFLDEASAHSEPEPGIIQEEPLINFDEPQSTPAPSFFDAPASVPSVNRTLNNVATKAVKIIDKPQRKVAQIQVIYADDTIEVFVPKK